MLDVDRNVFVDVNDNAVKLFKLPREELLRLGPEALSPEFQSDGLAVDRLALELRGTRVARRAARLRMAAPRRTRQGDALRGALHSLAVVEATPDPGEHHRQRRASSGGHLGLRRAPRARARGRERAAREDAAVRHAAHRAAPSGRQRRHQLARCRRRRAPVGRGERPVAGAVGASGEAADRAAVGVVRRRRIAGPAGRRSRRRDAIRSGRSSRPWLSPTALRACCSTPIVTTGDRVHGTLALYFDTVRGPNTEELDLVTRLTQLAGIAIRRKQDETALRDSEARFRSLFDNVVDGVYQAAPGGELLSANPALVQMLGLDDHAALGRCNMAEFFVDPKERARLVSELTAYGRVRHFEYQLRTRTGRVIIVLENSRLVTASDGRPAVLRRHDHRHHAAQGRRARAVQREGARSSHAPVDRRRRRDDGRARQHRVSEPRRRAAHGLGGARGAGLADRDDHRAPRRADRRSRGESRIALLAGGPRRHARRQRRARRRATARRSRFKIRLRRSRIATARSSAR